MVYEVAFDGTGVRVEQQLPWLVQQALARVERSVQAEAVPLARADAGQIAVPDSVRAFRERDQDFGVVRVEERDGHRARCRGPDRDVRARAVVARTKREGPAGPRGDDGVSAHAATARLGAHWHGL
jgi:hypothetical protein